MEFVVFSLSFSTMLLVCYCALDQGARNVFQISVLLFTYLLNQWAAYFKIGALGCEYKTLLCHNALLTSKLLLCYVAGFSDNDRRRIWMVFISSEMWEETCSLLMLIVFILSTEVVNSIQFSSIIWICAFMGSSITCHGDASH